VVDRICVGKYSFLVGCFLILFKTFIKSENMFRFINCMLLNFQGLVNLFINRKARGNLVK
jgi:hypothetical protein